MPIQNMVTFADRGFHILTLLDGATATMSGTWQPVFGYQPFTATIEGDFANASVQLYGTNYPSRFNGPIDDDVNHPTLLGVAVTDPQLIVIPNAINWVKAVVVFDEGGTGACWAYAFVG